MGEPRVGGSVAIRDAVKLMRLDAARWVRPGHVADISEVTPLVAARLLWRHPSLRAVWWLRIASAAHRAHIPGMTGLLQRRVLTRYGLDVSPSVPIRGGLYIAHPVGCVLHAEWIGENVSIISGVTFGTRTDERWPTIGDGVYVGAGARILGGVTIREDARIGANAVVITDVPAGATAVGVPARIIGPDAPDALQSSSADGERK